MVLLYNYIMNLKPKTSLLILGITSLICSRLMFFFFSDPEGPNPVVIVGMAAILYSLSLVVYLSNSLVLFTGIKRLLLGIFIQAILATGIFFLL